MPDVLSENISHFRNFSNYYKHLAGDIDYYNHSSPVLYTLDFNLLHPYLFVDRHSKYQVSDIVGRNIFSLLSTYHSSAGFTPVLSAPSFLELFDVITHRIDRLNKLAHSRERLSLLNDRLRSAFESPTYDAQQNIDDIHSFFRTIKVIDNNHQFDKFVKMVDKRNITMLVDHIDTDIFRSSRFKSFYGSIFDRMRAARSPDDDRDYDDKLFHYKVDSWNLAAAAVSQDHAEFEIDHICRPGISRYLPTELRTRRSRHPYVVLLRLYSLFMSPSEGIIQVEARDFVHEAVKNLDEQLSIMLSIKHISELSVIKRNEIDRIYNKYIRFLTMDFEDNLEANEWNRLREAIEDEQFKQYKSILTEDGLREKLHADAESLKSSAQAVFDTRPQLFDDRLLGDYDLRDNPRVKSIMKTLDI